MHLERYFQIFVVLLDLLSVYSYFDIDGGFAHLKLKCNYNEEEWIVKE